MELPHVLQTASIFTAFFAVVVYGMVAFKFIRLPPSFLVFGLGMCFNALQKVTLYLLFRWEWVWFLDNSVFPFCESVCYSVGSVLLLIHHRRVVDAFNKRVSEHFTTDL